MSTDSAATTDDLTRELDAERAHLVAAREALARMRARAQHVLEIGSGVSGDAYAAERLGFALTRRVAELTDDPGTPLFFGRLDFTQPPDGEHPRCYVGRRHVTDERHDPLVLDWRAPVSRAFYQASARDPHGVATRRRFGASGGALTSFEDEHLDRGEARDASSSRILAEEIERPRVGPMRDIVATIQPEQDDLVRAGLEQSLCVQGGPGTGKTAVGLHRAAYLLYTYRSQLERSRVLVVGPNRALLSYVSGILPALGEIDAEQLSIDEVYAAPVGASAVVPDAAETLKHDARMAQVLHRALWAHVAPAPEQLTVTLGADRYTLGRTELDEVVAEVLARRPTYDGGRELVRARVAARLERAVELRRAESPGEAWVRRTARSRGMTAFLKAVWPVVTPDRALRRLLSEPDLLAAAADGTLSDAEQQLLLDAFRARPRRAGWSAADAVLLDELAGLLERPTTYGHVIVDEAQDLSPMQCRTLARRSTHGSLTVLGDLAQGTTPWAARTWTDVLTHLGHPDAAVEELTTGFRVPGDVMTLANRLLPGLGDDLPVTTSLRTDGELRIRRTDDLPAAAVAECRTALEHEGSIGLIVPDALLADAGASLSEGGLEWAAADDVATEARITLVPASLAKGLEFDHVVALEPARIVAAEPRGLNRLYVVLTRAVSRLVVVHAEDLPAPLAG